MWIVEKLKYQSKQQELQVCIKLAELGELNVSAESLVSLFKEDLKKIKRTNCFAAEFAYKAKIIDSETVEIWKMKTNDDENYLMFRLKKGEDIPHPFDKW